MIVYNLKIQLKVKLSLCVLMGLGVFTAVCSVAKTVLFNRLSESSTGSDSTCKFLSQGKICSKNVEFADSGGSQDVVAPLVIWGM